MITPQELNAVNAEAVNQMLENSKQWLNNIVHGVTSGKTEQGAIKAFLFTYVLGLHDVNDPILTETDIRHLHSSLRKL